MPDLYFNIGVGQMIAMCIVSGGIFTQLIYDKLKLSIPIFQLTCMYFPLMIYLYFYLKTKKKEENKY